MCGHCCRGLRIPLNLSEAIDWLSDGGETQLLCEAIPWPAEPAVDNLLAAYKFQRSFPALSGTLPLRVIVTVVAAFDGPCPHLKSDLRCGAYDRRPRVCRIYPAEINPFIALRPAGKGCPPEAWDNRYPVLEASGRYVDRTLTADIEALRATDIRDVEAKQILSSVLGVRAAALANEGFVVVSPGRETMTRAIALAIDKVEGLDGNVSIVSWTLISNRCSTRDTLASVDAQAAAPEALPDGQTYLGFDASRDD
ncbi:MAG: YkgJ family cysteine cluster protein [Paraburkholderia sp.]|nr:YkgJ family cysteine cluster protein [Burkholderia sp. 4M9327F10]